MRVHDAHHPLWAGLSAAMLADRPRAADTVVRGYLRAGRRGFVSCLPDGWPALPAAAAAYGVPVLVTRRPDTFVRLTRLGCTPREPE